MKYALDRNGKYVHHADAKDSGFYRCPHCLEQVIIRKGKNACFSHTPIHDRTSLQRTCPEYHENSSYKKINNPLDIFYINNGGIPLYLCNDGKYFQLRAYFPMVSEESFNKLKQLGARIHVNTKSHSKTDEKIYNIDNLNFYPVNTIQKWIYVKCEPSFYESDVQQKWLRGIRGIDIKKDIYHSNKDGGYRVALKANINVGKIYRIMFNKWSPKIKGIDFKKIGKIFLKQDLKQGIVSKVIGVYEMNIKKFTEKAREFIESKGYKLVKNSGKLLPLWPPAVFTGNELTFNEHKAFFLHIKNSKKEKLYYTPYNRLFEINNTRINNYSIVVVQVNNNKSIFTSDEKKKGNNSEIKYNILYNSSLVKKQPIKQQIIIKDSNDTEVIFNEKNLKPPKNGKLYIKSNIPFCATVNNKNYVISSSNTCFENVNYFWSLIINGRAFGIKSYTYERKNTQIKLDNSIDWELEYLRFYRCTVPTVNVNNNCIQLLYLLSKNVNERNIQLYRLIETWVKTNAVPISAIRYINEIFKSLGGVVNE